MRQDLTHPHHFHNNNILLIIVHCLGIDNYNSYLNYNDNYLERLCVFGRDGGDRGED